MKARTNLVELKNTLSISHILIIGTLMLLMLTLLGLAILGYITPFIFAPPVDIDGIQEYTRTCCWQSSLWEQSYLAQMQ